MKFYVQRMPKFSSLRFNKLYKIFFLRMVHGYKFQLFQKLIFYVLKYYIYDTCAVTLQIPQFYTDKIIFTIFNLNSSASQKKKVDTFITRNFIHIFL